MSLLLLALNPLQILFIFNNLKREEPAMSLKGKILESLSRGPASAEDLRKRLGAAISSIHSTVHDLRKTGQKIVSRNGAYHLDVLNLALKPSQTVAAKRDPRVALLSDKLLAEYYDMTQKAFFYTRAAEALLSSVEHVERIKI